MRRCAPASATPAARRTPAWRARTSTITTGHSRNSAAVTAASTCRADHAKNAYSRRDAASHAIGAAAPTPSIRGQPPPGLRPAGKALDVAINAAVSAAACETSATALNKNGSPREAVTLITTGTHAKHRTETAAAP